MARVLKRKLSKKEARAAGKPSFIENRKAIPVLAPQNRRVAVPEIISVKDFADRAKLSVAAVISALMKNGVLATINQTIDFDTASIIGVDLGLEVFAEEALAQIKQTNIEIEANNLWPRPPVVTIMGHVDHGKTTLLDKIRTSRVAEAESGGITQHISAYQVELKEAKHKGLKGRSITFIDTPGHAAFSRMREHGAAITDIVVLIVAANDGVMPQTKEVIEKARENHISIIVAINKIDLPDADSLRTKQQLSELGVSPEEWGGKTIMLEISAKTGQGISDLLEMILLQADLLELKADPESPAIGVVIESRVEKGVGNTAVVLIENGTLHLSEPIAIGSSWGRVRTLSDYGNRRIKSAGPATPVKIAGLRSLPNFGDRLIAFGLEKEAREAALRAERGRTTLHIATAAQIEPAGAEVIAFNIIIKSDVAGSIEAIRKLIAEIHHPEIAIRLVSEGVGAVSESDITLAKAAAARVFGFRVPILQAAKKIAEIEGISVKTFDVIYKMIDTIKAEASRLLPLEIIEEEIGRAKVLAIFRDDRKALVAGGRVLEGRVAKGDEIKVLEGGKEKYRSKITSLRQGKNEIGECGQGIECGFSLSAGADIGVGDEIVAFKTEKRERSIE